MVSLPDMRMYSTEYIHPDNGGRRNGMAIIARDMLEAERILDEMDPSGKVRIVGEHIISVEIHFFTPAERVTFPPQRAGNNERLS